MRIMVFDVPAESGGALTILKQYYDIAVEDNRNEWIFVISTPNLSERKNVRVLKFPWIKKSWLHRLYFDIFVAHKLVKQYEVDEVLSLQNIIIPYTKVNQTLYLHQPLPFIKKKYRITENAKFWVYQNIISKMIYMSIKKADKVIVQTKWMMDAAIEKTRVKKDKFILEQPKLSNKVKQLYNPKDKFKKLFFYPASGFIYKNHEVIVNAAKILMQKGISNFRIIFTLDGNENNHIKKQKEVVDKNKLPIDYIGNIDIEKVYEYYSKAILIFPSYIETFGLPLLEAKMHHTPILASDCDFSHEILDDYDKVEFFDPFNCNVLSIKMENILRTAN